MSDPFEEAKNAAGLGEADLPQPPADWKPKPPKDEDWLPQLNPTQLKAVESLAKYILLYAEKASGKTIACCHALIRHCYEEDDALALIIAPSIRTGSEGVIYDLCRTLDIWRNGNRDPKDLTGKRRIDAGLGLDYTEPLLDPNTKDRVIYIRNRHGGKSKVVLISLPYEEVVERRMKALSPSFVYADEITELASKKYFTYVAQQIGRRAGIVGPQQYYASCNPEGPSHWVYQVWWQDCINGDTGQRKPAFEAYHVPIQENIHNLPPGYIEGLYDIYSDPIDRERLLTGKWVDRPSGEAIFKDQFRPEFHVRGNRTTGTVLTPKPGFPIVVSYDPGPRNYSVHFEQMIIAKTDKGTRPIWLVFDELNFVGRLMPDHQIVPIVLRQMDFWQSFLKGSANFIHVADESAFTHARHDGSYDATRLLQLSNGRIRARSAMTGVVSKGSVSARVQMLMSLFLEGGIYISSRCVKTIEMLNCLVSESPKKDKYEPLQGLQPKRSVHLHPFDSLTYGIFYFTMRPKMFALQTETVPAEDKVFRAGRG